MLPATNVIPFCDPDSFDIDCIFGVDIGRDRSNNFMLGFDGGALKLAIRTSDDRFVIPVLRGGIAQLIDVTCLKFGIDPCVFRFPVLDVNPGDLIVTADSPFSALFVVKSQGDGGIQGVVPGRQELVTYLPPKNLFGSQFYVKVFSLFGGFGGGGGGGLFGGGGGGAGGLGALLPFLLCCQDFEGLKDNKLLYALLLSQSFGGGVADAAANPLLPLLLFSGEKSGSSLALLLAASGGQLFAPQAQQQQYSKPVEPHSKPVEPPSGGKGK